MTREYDTIRDIGAEVVAISVDDLSNAKTIARNAGIPFPVLYNPDTNVVRDYGVYDLLGDGLAAPATFVIDTDGIIRFKQVGRSIGDRTSADEVLEQLGLLEG